MSCIKFVGVLAMITAFSLQTQAAAPILPPDSIGSDVVAVIHIDAAHFTPDSFRTAVQTVLGDNADKAKDTIAKFQERYDKASKAGVEAMTFVMTSTPPKPNAAALTPDEQPPIGRSKPIVYIQLKPGADADAVQKMMTDEMPPAERAKTVVDQNGNFMALHDKDTSLPQKPDAARARMFSDALGTIAAASVQIAFIPDAKTKADMTKAADGERAPKAMRDAMPFLANSRWITLSINFGNTPGLTATANVADAASAKQLADAVTTSLDDLKKQAASGGGPGAMFGPLIEKVVGDLAPTQNGNQVTVGLKGQSLTMIANLAINFSGMAGGGGGPRSRPPAQ